MEESSALPPYRKRLQQKDSDDPLEECSLEDKEKLLLEEISLLYSKLDHIRQEREFLNEGDSCGLGETKSKCRLLLVSRRLPFQLNPINTTSPLWQAEYLDDKSIDDETLENFLTLHKSYPNCLWIGSLGCEVESNELASLKEQLFRQHSYLPIFLDSKKETLFYDGFCKTVLWPLFHSSPPTTEEQILSHDEEIGEEDQDEECMWQAYVATNQAFADAIQDVYEDGDLLWIQGYHLALLPQMLKNVLPNAKLRIGFFLHIPFPSSELYRMIPYREEILLGILAADLIGFQTYEYARHFRSSTMRVLGLESNYKGISINGHFAHVTICPVGIDPERIATIASSQRVRDRIVELETQFKGKKVILGVDRLDPTKGLVHKFLAIEEMFATNSDLADELVIIQVVSLQESHRAEYHILETQIEAMVSRINSKLQEIGTIAPIQYLTRDVTMEDLVALYSVTHVLLSTPIRDGMNTVPFHYVLCREFRGECGTVILSEFAGCAQSLGGAMLVNPWDTEEVAETMIAALGLSKDEQRRNHQSMCQYISTFTSYTWAENFVEQLQEANEDDAPTTGRELDRRDISSAYLRTKKRLIFLNYDGVLVQDSWILDISKPSDTIMEWLNHISNDPANTVLIVSSRSATVMEKWFGDLPVILAAEYGAYVRWNPGEDMECILPNLDMSWWEDAMPLLQYYTERTPGAFLEKKESAVTWHYGDCDIDHGFCQSTELQVMLQEITRTNPISVIPGNKTLEIRPCAVSKATLFELLWERLSKKGDEDNGIDFVLVVAPGEDRTDEDLFAVFQQTPPPISESKVHDELSHGEYGLPIPPITTTTTTLPPTTTPSTPLAQSTTRPPLLQQQELMGTQEIDQPPHLSPSLVEGSLSSSTNLSFPVNGKNKYTPRKDFPPSSSLFKAMRKKYGENFGRYKLPDTPAACWALVLPPENRIQMIQEEHERGAYLSYQRDNRFPVNTFVCTVGRKLSQAPYFVKRLADLYSMLCEIASISSKME